MYDGGYTLPTNCTVLTDSISDHYQLLQHTNM